MRLQQANIIPFFFDLSIYFLLYVLPAEGSHRPAGCVCPSHCSISYLQSSYHELPTWSAELARRLMYSGRRRQAGALPIYQECIRILNIWRESPGPLNGRRYGRREVLGTHGGTGLCRSNTQTNISLGKGLEGIWLNFSSHPQRWWEVYFHDTHDPNYSCHSLDFEGE